MILREKHIRIVTQDQRGLGLVETLVAVAVLGTSVVAFAIGLSTESVSIREQDEIATAQGLAQSQVEYIKSLPFIPGATTYPAIDTPPGYSLSTRVGGVPGTDTSIQIISVTASHEDIDLLTIESYKVNR